MITTSVRVIARQNGKAWVESTEKSGCGGCASRQSCGVSSLGEAFDTKHQLFEITCPNTVGVGQEVQLQIAERDLLKASLLAYLLPVMLMLSGAIGATLSGAGDSGTMLGTLIGLLLGLWIVSRYRMGDTGWRYADEQKFNFNQGETA